MKKNKVGIISICFNPSESFSYLFFFSLDSIFHTNGNMLPKVGLLVGAVDGLDVFGANVGEKVGAE